MYRNIAQIHISRIIYHSFFKYPNYSKHPAAIRKSNRVLVLYITLIPFSCIATFLLKIFILR